MPTTSGALSLLNHVASVLFISCQATLHFVFDTNSVFTKQCNGYDLDGYWGNITAMNILKAFNIFPITMTTMNIYIASVGSIWTYVRRMMSSTLHVQMVEEEEGVGDGIPFFWLWLMKYRVNNFHWTETRNTVNFIESFYVENRHFMLKLEFSVGTQISEEYQNASGELAARHYHPIQVQTNRPRVHAKYQYHRNSINHKLVTEYRHTVDPINMYSCWQPGTQSQPTSVAHSPCKVVPLLHGSQKMYTVHRQNHSHYLLGSPLSTHMLIHTSTESWHLSLLSLSMLWSSHPSQTQLSLIFCILPIQGEGHVCHSGKVCVGRQPSPVDIFCHLQQSSTSMTGRTWAEHSHAHCTVADPQTALKSLAQAQHSLVVQQSWS